ncbi:MAG: hypothetical protein A2Y14_02795 [Verrucomicrobia bacterium GWF2_51_19]|nr:MAG: hypothetical protein A2Y14_02795 [Verrucomicrobia bacterium GWF2_51_19]
MSRTPQNSNPSMFFEKVLKMVYSKARVVPRRTAEENVYPSMLFEKVLKMVYSKARRARATGAYVGT